LAARTPELLAFGTAVRKLRVEHGMTQDALAEKVGTHRNYVGMLERGERNPTLLVILRFANALEADAGRLVQEAHLEAQ
jgi:transcriptional regulator with XRE-family HTH domain